MKRLLRLTTLGILLLGLGGFSTTFQEVLFSKKSAVVAVAYQGPCDVISLSGFWGFRSCSASYAAGGTGKAANICDVATGLVCSDVNFLTNGYFDATTAAALTQCATSCNVATLYDSSGHAHNATQATNSQRPILTFNAIHTYACATFSVAGNSKLVSTLSFSSLVISMIGIGSRNASITSIQSLLSGDDGTNQARLGWTTSANTAVWFPNSTGFQTSGTAADNTFHAFVATYAGSGGITHLYIDGTDNASTGSSLTTTGNYSLGNSSTGTARPLDGVFCEAAPDAANLVASAAALNSNMRAAYGGL